MRILLIGYLYGITSRRKLVEELCAWHLAWRWFTGLGFDKADPASLHVFEKPAWTVSQESETVRAVVRTDREAVRGSGTGVQNGNAHLSGRWKLCGGERGQGGAVFHASSCQRRRHNSTARCVSIWRTWSSRNPVEEPVHQQDRYRPQIQIRPTPPRAARRLGWDTTTTIWSTTIVV